MNSYTLTVEFSTPVSVEPQDGTAVLRLAEALLAALPVSEVDVTSTQLVLNQPRCYCQLTEQEGGPPNERWLFQPGDKVRIVLEGVVKSHAGPGWAVVVEDEDGFTNWDASVIELIERP